MCRAWSLHRGKSSAFPPCASCLCIPSPGRAVSLIVPSPGRAVLCPSLFVVWSSMSQEAVVGGLVIAGAALVVNGCPLSHMPNIACCYRMPLNSPPSGRQSHHALLLPLRRHCISHLPDVCVSGCRPVCFVPNRIVVLIHAWRVTCSPLGLALEHNDNNAQREWLTYWAVYGCFTGIYRCPSHTNPNPVSLAAPAVSLIVTCARERCHM